MLCVILINIYFKDHIVMKKLHVLFVCLPAVLGSNKDCLNWIELNWNSDAIVIEDSKFKWCFFFVLEDEQVIEEAYVLMWI